MSSHLLGTNVLYIFLKVEGDACGPGFFRVRFASVLRTGRQVARLAYPYRWVKC